MANDAQPSRNSVRLRPTRLVAVVALAALIVLGVGTVVVFRPGATAPSAATASRTASQAPDSSAIPTGGVTRERAIEIALQGKGRGENVVSSASAAFSHLYNRWLWSVTWSYVAGPTAGEGCRVVIDFFSGEILDQQCWVS